MAFTTQRAVQKYLTIEYKANDNLQPFIELANGLVTNVVSCATDRGMTLTFTQKEHLERLLAAHFYKSSMLSYKRKETQEAEGEFMGFSDGKGLEGTRHGQNAMAMDPTGCLKSFNNGVLNIMSWLGKPPSEQVDYEDRN